jgi:hypothetical protein
MKTFDGIEIKRWKNDIGKRIGSAILFHSSYRSYICGNSYYDALGKLRSDYREFFNKFNCALWNKATGETKFIYSKDFDTAREPHVGEWISVSRDGSVKRGISNRIWHHKWLLVRDTYVKFDVFESKEWSKKWLSILKEPAKKTDESWKEQLKRYGLE